MNERIRLGRNLVEGLLEVAGSSTTDFTYSEIKELILHVLEQTESEDDFEVDSNMTKGGDVRMIDGDAIDEIHHESLIEQIKECYDLSDLPSFIEIDWDKTANNCAVDGYGHHFASYNGEEYETENWWFFRTN